MTQRAALAEPDNIAYRDSYGWALLQLGRYDEAVEQLRRAVSDESPDGVILDHLGDALLRTDGQAPAVDAWQRALEALGDEEPQRQEQIRLKIEQATTSHARERAAETE